MGVKVIYCSFVFLLFAHKSKGLQKRVDVNYTLQ